MGVIADGALLDTLRRAATFGLFLVRLDVRQDSTRHAAALSEITEYLELGNYAEWDEKTRQEFLLEELASRRPLLPANYQPSAETAEVLATCRVIGAGAGSVAGLLRDLDGRPAVRRAGGATAAQGERPRPADARGAAVRDPRRPGQRRPLHGPPAEPAGLPLPPVRAAGSDDRLLRLGQGRRHPGGGLGAVPGAGGAGGDLPPPRRRAAVLPWPRRHRRPRRRSGPRGDPVAAAGLRGRALPRHRTGRDDPLQVRPAGHRRTEPQPLPGRGAGSHPAAAAGAGAGLARADGPPGRRRAAGLPRGGAGEPAVRRLLPRGHAGAGTGPPAAGQPPGQAPRGRGGKPAGDPLDLRLDPDAPDAAGLAGLGRPPC